MHPNALACPDIRHSPPFLINSAGGWKWRRQTPANRTYLLNEYYVLAGRLEACEMKNSHRNHIRAQIEAIK